MGFEVIRSARSRVLIGTALLLGVLVTVVIRCDLITGLPSHEHPGMHVAVVDDLSAMDRELAAHFHPSDDASHPDETKAITSSRADFVRTLAAAAALAALGFVATYVLLSVTSRGPPGRCRASLLSGRVLLNTICINRC